MKHLPKSTLTEILNDPYGFTYKEMSEVIGENEAKALYEELYKQLPRKKNLSMLVKYNPTPCKNISNIVLLFFAIIHYLYCIILLL